MPQKLIAGTIQLYMCIIRDSSFNPSAKKFHYQFNLRELSKVCEGIMQADPSNYRMSKQKIVRIWIHEVKRVFQDRLVFEEDISKFNEYLLKALPVISDGNV